MKGKCTTSFTRVGWVTLSLVMLASSSALAQSERVFVRSSRLLERPDWSELGRLGATEQGWIDVIDDSVWVVDPVAWTIVNARLSGGESVTRRVRGASGSTVTAVRRDPLAASQVRSVPLPGGVQRPASGRPVLRIVGSSGDAAWLIDAGAQQIWRLEGGAWRRIRQAGEALAGATKLSGDRLLVNTPGNPGYLFAIIDVTGRIERRFGVRQPISRAGLTDEVANTWHVARLPNGTVVAAEGFGPLARAYSEGGELLWERRLGGPTVRRLLEAQAAKGPVPGALVSSILFAQGVFATATGFLVRYGLGSRLDEYDGAGAWQREWVLSLEGPPVGPVWAAAGVAVSGDHVLAAERGG